jgi:hypothetical protein
LTSPDAGRRPASRPTTETPNVRRRAVELDDRPGGLAIEEDLDDVVAGAGLERHAAVPPKNLI